MRNGVEFGIRIEEHLMVNHGILMRFSWEPGASPKQEDIGLPIFPRDTSLFKCPGASGESISPPEKLLLVGFTG